MIIHACRTFYNFPHASYFFLFSLGGEGGFLFYFDRCTNIYTSSYSLEKRFFVSPEAYPIKIVIAFGSEEKVLACLLFCSIFFGREKVKRNKSPLKKMRKTKRVGHLYL